MAVIKNKTVFILVVAMVTLSLFGVMFVLFNNNRDKGIIENMTISGVEQSETVKEWTISNLCLAPGDKDERKINLNFQSDGDYKIILEFTETYDGGLKEYIDVTIMYGQTTVEDQTSLEELFTENTVDYNYTHDSDAVGVVPLTVIYKMPVTVGDGLSVDEQRQIMGTSSKFNLKITVKRV